MSDTPTPRTEMMVGLRNPVWVPGNTALISTEFARQLERELAAANKRIRRLESAGERLRSALRLAVGDDATGWESGDGVDIGTTINAAMAEWDSIMKP